MKIELAYSLDREFRYTKNGSWYMVEVRGNLGRWRWHCKSRKPMDFAREIAIYHEVGKEVQEYYSRSAS